CCSSRRRHTRSKRDWSSDVCSSDLKATCPVCSKERMVTYSKKGDIIRKCKECSRPKTIGKKLIDANGYVRVQTHNGWVYEHRLRSEERRVGREKGYRWSAGYGKTKD